MNGLSYIIAPTIGAFIGYITNFIAIKMLFRPLNPKYLFGFKVPFTPGIIPREKARLAKSIGDVIGEKLLTEDTIIDTLTLPSFQHKIEEFIDEQLINIKNHNKKIDELLLCAVDEDELQHLITVIENDATEFLYHKINSPEVMDKLTHHISQSLDDYMEKQMEKPFAKVLLGLNKGLIDSAKHLIASKIKEIFLNDTYEVIENLVHDELKNILDMPINDLLNHWDDRIPKIKKILLTSLNRAIRNNIKVITSALNISAMVEKRINEFDILEVEKLILSVADKELKAIIWLGAFLGFLMGFLMPLLA